MRRNSRNGAAHCCISSPPSMALAPRSSCPIFMFPLFLSAASARSTFLSSTRTSAATCKPSAPRQVSKDVAQKDANASLWRTCPFVCPLLCHRHALHLFDTGILPMFHNSSPLGRPPPPPHPIFRLSPCSTYRSLPINWRNASMTPGGRTCTTPIQKSAWHSFSAL